MLSVSKPSSLIQQKKQQWAREREEMSHLYLPWNSSDQYNGGRLQVRNQFASSFDLHNQTGYEYQEPTQRQRSPSLPPIHHLDQITKGDLRNTKDVLNRNISAAKRFAFYDEDGEGDTSGYGSETINQRTQNGVAHELPNSHPVLAWQQAAEENRPNSGGRTDDGRWSSRSTRANASEEGRPRWGDRGVATGRLWEPTAPNARLPQVPSLKKGTPSWVERGLNMIDNTAEVLVIDQNSSSNSGFECDKSSCNGSEEGKTYLRGQNIPLEPEIKAQRENKRIKALELQSAILSQLEDQEKRRQEERERRLREEKLEELRIQRQQEEDQLRIEQEKRKNQERQLLEQRKLDTLKKALEDAENKARLEKEKRFINHKRNLSDNTTIKETPPKTVEVEDDYKPSPNISPTKSHRTYDVHSAKSLSPSHKDKDNNSRQTTQFNSPRSIGPTSLNLLIPNVPPLSLNENQYSVVPIGMNSDIINSSHSGIQLAVLVPQNISSSLYNLSINSLNHINDESEKTLTPRKYRTLRIKNASTQTDSCVIKYCIHSKTNEGNERNIDKDYPNIDEDAPQDNHSSVKKDRRFRSEERFKKEIENRPKWGVNRPAAQYKKQSEKDPFYSQKRKMRHIHRSQARQYLSQSSDDSRSPSPPALGERNSVNSKARNSLSQSYWRNKKTSPELHKMEEVTNMSQTDISFNQISNECIMDGEKSPTNLKMSPIKRLTLSQKFINDKYGNRKLWLEDGHVKLNHSDTENRKKLLDQINIAKKEYLERWVLFSKQVQSEHQAAMSKLDDLFDKKKDEAPMLDLSKTVINTPEEYRAVLDKVPDFKTRPEKVRAEDVKIRDSKEDQKTKTPRKEIKAYEKLGTRGYEEKHFTFMDPIPVEMRGLKFDELCAVPIEWRMLTSIRPKSKLDEEYFNRMVELGKSELRTKARDKREFSKNNMIRKTKNRSGVTETRIVSCPECCEEYCDGKMCVITNYDMFARIKVETEPLARARAAAPVAGRLRRLRRRGRRKTRSKSAADDTRASKNTKHAKSDSEL